MGKPEESKRITGPNVWMIVDAGDKLGYALAQEALRRGDRVALCCKPEQLQICSILRAKYQYSSILVELDIRNIALCQSSIVHTLSKWDRIDIFVNFTNTAYLGTIEEVEEWHMRDQFENSFFGPVNIIRSILPHFRAQKSGHIINIGGISGFIGTPCCSLLCSANHALEGYLEALTMEMLPFEIRVTVVETLLEEITLDRKIIQAKKMEIYNNSLGRELESLLANAHLQSEILIEQTIKSIISIAGTPNPPTRLIVGKVAMEQIKDKLKIVSEEIEQYHNTSKFVDIKK